MLNSYFLTQVAKIFYTKLENKCLTWTKNDDCTSPSSCDNVTLNKDSLISTLKEEKFCATLGNGLWTKAIGDLLEICQFNLTLRKGLKIKFMVMLIKEESILYKCFAHIKINT